MYNKKKVLGSEASTLPTGMDPKKKKFKITKVTRKA